MSRGRSITSRQVLTDENTDDVAKLLTYTSTQENETCTALNLTTTASVVIDWGDSIYTVHNGSNLITHTYLHAGVHTVSIKLFKDIDSFTLSSGWAEL
jgi:hypothetical protein